MNAPLWDKVSAIAALIDEACEVCTCGAYNADGPIGCRVPHDAHALDLSAALESYAGQEQANATDAKLTLGEIYHDAIYRLSRAHPSVAWNEIVSDEIECARQFGLPRRAA